jgi:hypothetical protein
MSRLIQIEEGRVFHIDCAPEDIERLSTVIEGAVIYEGPWPEDSEFYKWDEATETVVSDEEFNEAEGLKSKIAEADSTAEAEVPKTITITLGNQTDTFPLNERYINIIRNEIYYQEQVDSSTMTLLNSKYEIIRNIPLNVGKTIFVEMWKQYRKVLGRKAQLAQARKSN